MTPSRYGIYLADLDPTVGRDIVKVSPVVVSLDAMNELAGTVAVCPLTTKLHPGWRSRLPVKCAGKSAEVAVDPICTISTRRLTRRIDSLPAEKAARLRERIVEMYGLP